MKPCPTPAAPKFFEYGGAVERRRQEGQEHTHMVVECVCGKFHVLRRVDEMRGAA